MMPRIWLTYADIWSLLPWWLLPFAFPDALLTSASCLRCTCERHGQATTVLCLYLRCGLAPRLIMGQSTHSSPPQVFRGSLSVSSRVDANCLLHDFGRFLLHFMSCGLNRDCLVDTVAIWEGLRMVLLIVMFTLMLVSFYPLVLQHFSPRGAIYTAKSIVFFLSFSSFPFQTQVAPYLYM